MIRRIVPHLVALILAIAFAAPAIAGQADSTNIDWSRVAEYRIVPGDKLSVNLGPRGDNAIDNIRDQKVRPDGRITMFPIGDVVAAGLTPMELQRSLVALLSADLRQPRVTVEVVEPAGNVVHVLGRVEKPGSYPAGPFVTVMQAISAAGGLKDDAARNSVLVFHRDGARTVSVSRVRLDRVLKGYDLEDLPLSKFDIVFIPRSTIGNVGVFVTQFFGPISQTLAGALVGWELFNLDRVFVTRVVAE